MRRAAREDVSMVYSWNSREHTVARTFPNATSSSSSSSSSVSSVDPLASQQLSDPLHDPLRFLPQEPTEPQLRERLEETLQTFSEARGLVDFFSMRLESMEGSTDGLGKLEVQGDIDEQIEIVTQARKEVLGLSPKVNKDALDPYYKPLLAEILLLDNMEALRVKGFKELRGKEAPELNVATDGILKLVEGMRVQDVPDLSTDDSPERGRMMGVGRVHDLTVSGLSKREAAVSQYIRFVKATKLRGTELSSTVPGYVTFGNKAEVGGDTEARRSAVNSRHAGGAQWSFDGPGKGVDARGPDALNIIDEPGELSTVASHYPYILKMDFVGVVYDPITLKIRRKTEYSDYHEELTDPHAQARAEQLNRLRNQQKPPPGTKQKVNAYI